MMRAGAGSGSASAHHQSTSSIYFGDPHNHRPNDVCNVDANSLQSERLGRPSRAKLNQFLFPAFFIECSILACLAAFAYYLRFTSEFKGHQRLIQCLDYTLAYPHLADNAISSNSSLLVQVDHTTLYCVSFLVPVGLIILSEIVLWLFAPPARKVISTFTKSFRIPLVIRRIFRFVGTFWMGALILSILTDSLKLLSGRPRPYFLSVCNVTSCNLQAIFITASDCQTSNDDDLRDAQLSFPSYFAALSSFAAVFSVCYTQTMANVHGSYFLRPVLLAAFVGMSLLASFSRWMHYANHWEDLLFGYIMGSAFAIYISFGILNRFRENKDPTMSSSAVNQAPEEPHSWFSWLAIPRISTHRSTTAKSGGPGLGAPTVYMNGGGGGGNSSETNSSSVGDRPNPAFQQEIHRRVEDFGRKNLNSGSPGGRGDQLY